MYGGICRILENQVKLNGDKTAVVCEGNKLSYNQLNELINRMAWRLHQLGCGPNIVVPLYFRRGIDFLVSLLAIFKCGGAYLPLDPNYPTNRLQWMLKKSESKYLIVSKELSAQLGKRLKEMDNFDIKTIIYEDLLASSKRKDNLGISTGSDDLAYVIFTSGSTGMPKGGMNEHKGMINHIFSKINDLQITSRDRIAQIASQCFDISIWQFLSALLVGGEVYILPDEITKNPQMIIEYIAKNEISIFQVVPSLLRVIIQETCSNEQKIELPKVRWVALVGEALSPTLARQWFNHYPNIPLLNSYGPTECSDGVTHYKVLNAPDLNVVNMPIGKPIPNLQVHICKVVNNKLTRCAEGEEGELCG